MRRRDESKKDAIFQATKELLNEIGFAETSMSKIAKRAGVSAATLYVYFENKDDMLKKLYLDVKGKLATSIVGAIEPGQSIKETVNQGMRGYLAFLLQNREDYLFLEQFSHSPILKNLCIEEALPSFDALHGAIEKGMREGVLRPVDENLLLTYCYLPIMQIVKEQERGVLTITEEMISTIIEMSWNAVRA